MGLCLHTLSPPPSSTLRKLNQAQGVPYLHAQGQHVSYVSSFSLTPTQLVPSYQFPIAGNTHGSMLSYACRGRGERAASTRYAQNIVLPADGKTFLS